jgi:hypothetical protein
MMNDDVICHEREARNKYIGLYLAVLSEKKSILKVQLFSIQRSGAPIPTETFQVPIHLLVD